MNNLFGPLSEEDVRKIALLIETLDRSSLDFLQVELGDARLTIGKGEPAPAASDVAAPPVPVPPAPAPAPLPAAAAPAPAPAIPQPAAPPAASAAAPRAVADGSEAITAPIMGRFFAKPDPASPPFVTVGSEVEEGTTVALIEVMKVFNAVQAGMRGVITEICVADAELVEYGQPMFRVRPVA